MRVFLFSDYLLCQLPGENYHGAYDVVVLNMEPVLMSTLLFIPNGHTEVISIRFYLSDHEGLWDIDTNNVYLNQQLWNQWRDCKNDHARQKKFFSGLRKVSGSLLY